VTARHQHVLSLLRRRDPGEGLSLDEATPLLGLGSREKTETLLKYLEGKGQLRKTGVRPRRWGVV
jgi:hypothetical protein